MATMRAAQVGRPGGDLEFVAREIPEPARGQVRIKVEACGICHSDALVKQGHLPGVVYPRVPGHEIAGSIDKVGPEVTRWAKGERVGVGWHGGHCFGCGACRAGDYVNCENGLVTGASFDGGYAEYAVVPQEALARIPDGLRAAEAAPLMCAGITTYNALRHSGARGGDLVAIQGIGGLGHLGVQFARKMGFRTVAISSGRDKEDLARKLGADVYIDSASEEPARTLLKLGGARVALATAPHSGAISALTDGLAPNGTLMIVGAAAEPIQVSPIQLIRGRKSIRGWASGHPADSEETMKFAVLTGVRPMIETYPLARAAQALERMMTNKARFRVVLRMED
ncbi:MAG TPA: alcohol dehydrogenase [Candidatus Polarisedimenticolia bacterium]|nr:alcohol dehydrogenase [Candidatus Polarisedimenticolia bacterium]